MYTYRYILKKDMVSIPSPSPISSNAQKKSSHRALGRDVGPGGETPFFVGKTHGFFGGNPAFFRKPPYYRSTKSRKKGLLVNRLVFFRDTPSLDFLIRLSYR